MHSSIVNSRPVVLSASLVLLTAAALLLRPLAYRLDDRLASGGLRSEQLRSLPGHDATLAVLGGMRSTVASGFWLRANLAWERRDPAATRLLVALTVAADERPAYFWLNGARMLAYDLPEWSPPAPAAVRERLVADHARLALDFLEKGSRWHGPDAALYVEMGNIHLRRTHDLESAARCYRLAAQQPGAPYYAARIHGELLPGRWAGRARPWLGCGSSSRNCPRTIRPPAGRSWPSGSRHWSGRWRRAGPDCDRWRRL